MKIRDCPLCNKNMIKRYASMLPSDMLEHSGKATHRWAWWCGNCGHTIIGGTATDDEADDVYDYIWKQMNPKEQWL